MEQTQKVPELRFPEFEGEWNSEKLENLASFSKGRGISKNDISDDGETPCIRYGELYTLYNEIIDEVESSTNLPSEGLVFSEAGDVIIPASGETQIDIATASCVLRSGVALSGDLNIIRSSINGVFLAYYLGSIKKLEIASLAQGNSVVHLYARQLKSLTINLPKESEQQKITTFLAAVDENIRQLAAKRDAILEYKRGVMQRIFSQEIRFKDENGEAFPDWEEKKLGEVLSFGSGKDYKHLNEGDIPVFGTGGLMTHVDEYLHNGESVGIGRKGTIDKPVFLSGKFWTVDTLFYTHSFVN
ncbi:MAG: restriction endonuclease subunit S, partial [Bacteroidota bacterium]